MIHVQGPQLSSQALMSSTCVAMVYKQLDTFMFANMARCS